MDLSSQAHPLTPVVLIVEDDPFIALNLEALLAEYGFDILGPAGNVEQALALVSETKPDAAVLDVNLGCSRVTPVAATLAERGVPFVLASSERTEDLEPPLAEVPNLGKPTDAKQLLDTLQLLLEQVPKSETL